MSRTPTLHHIVNRHGQRIVAYVYEPTVEVVGTVVMVHGLSSSSNRPIFTETTNPLVDAGYRVVRYDATHSLGGSAGDPQYCTMTSLYEDLDDVLEEFWYSQHDKDGQAGQLILFGHSLGAMVAGLRTVDADALILASSVTDGKKSFEYSWAPDEIDDWEAIGYVERGVGRDNYHRIRFSHYHDRCAYTLLDTNYTQSMYLPVLLISGTEDADRPGTNDLARAIQEAHGRASQVTRLDLEGAGHSIREAEYLEQINLAIADFIKNV